VEGRQAEVLVLDHPAWVADKAPLSLEPSTDTALELVPDAGTR